MMDIPIRPTSSHSSNIPTALMSEFNIDQDSSTQLAMTFQSLQATIGENGALLIGKTDTVPYELILSSNAIFPIKEENFLARGTYSKVFKVSMITTCSHQLGSDNYEPGDITLIALKIWEGKAGSSPTYSPEKRQLQQFLSPKKRGIDDYLATFKIPLHAGYSIHKLFDVSIEKAHFEKYDAPIKTLLTILISSTQGLCAIHERNGIHRDIKGGNILALITQEEIIGALTDFSFVMSALDRLHLTIGTPEYLDPGMFGSIEYTLLNQKKRVGIQTKAGDVYSYGVMLYIDILCKLLSRMSKNSGHEQEICACLKNIALQKIQGPFQNEELQEHGKNHPYRVIYRHQSPTYPELIWVFPPLKTIRTNLIDGFNLLNNCLTPSEINALCSLSSLSCDMQEPNLEERPTIHQVKESFMSILEQFIGNEPWKKSANDRNSPPTAKRKIDFELESGAEPTTLNLEPPINRTLPYEDGSD